MNASEILYNVIAHCKCNKLPNIVGGYSNWVEGCAAQEKIPKGY